MVCGLALTATTVNGQQQTIEERADARAERISDAQAFVREIDQSIALAQAGDYGRIKAGDMDRVVAARNTIATLLEGRTRATELPPEQRIELYNAQELITSIIRNDEKNRKVCKRVQVAGSRVTKNECLTVAEREARARAAKDTAARLQRLDCVPGPGNPCG
jgi:signal transduction histidine kinase